MPSRILRTPSDVAALSDLLGGLKLPITVSWAAGADRSNEQSALMWIWAGEVADQLQDRTQADQQAEWKLTIGVPILREDSATFREAYDRVLKGLSYEEKIVVMRDLDFPVTRLMKVGQMCRFMNEVQRRTLEAGLMLTEPKDDLADYHARYGRALAEKEKEPCL